MARKLPRGRAPGPGRPGRGDHRRRERKQVLAAVLPSAKTLLPALAVSLLVRVLVQERER